MLVLGGVSFDFNDFSIGMIQCTNILQRIFHSQFRIKTYEYQSFKIYNQDNKLLLKQHHSLHLNIIKLILHQYKLQDFFLLSHQHYNLLIINIRQISAIYHFCDPIKFLIFWAKISRAIIFQKFCRVVNFCGIGAIEKQNITESDGAVTGKCST